MLGQRRQHTGVTEAGLAARKTQEVAQVRRDPGQPRVAGDGQQQLMELVGVGYKEGSSLIESLHQHISAVTCKYEHIWQNGDLVMWDNQATIHYRPAFKEQVRRVLKRVTIGGGVPF